MSDKKDRFGLKIHSCLTDDDALESLEAEETFIADAVATAIRLFGPEKAKRLVLEEIAVQTAAPRPGKQPDQELNEYLLGEFDRQIANGLRKTAAVKAAAKAAKDRYHSLGIATSIVSRIWVLLRERKKSQRAWAEYEIALAEDQKKRPMLILDEIESESNHADL
jgi:hypothetical protein